MDFYEPHRRAIIWHSFHRKPQFRLARIDRACTPARPLNDFGMWNILFNALRYFGRSGDQGVQLFLIASGFGLTWGLLNRQAGKPLNIGIFY